MSAEKLAFNSKRYNGKSSQLPFKFGRVDSGGGNPVDPTPDGKSAQIAICFATEFGNARTISSCSSQIVRSDVQIAVCLASAVHLSEQVAVCSSSKTAVIEQIDKCSASEFGDAVQVEKCSSSKLKGSFTLNKCSVSEFGDAIQIEKCSSVLHSGKQFEKCSSSEFGDAVQIEKCSSALHAGKQIEKCAGSIVQDGVLIECVHYEIPEPEPKQDKPEWRCGRPKASKLTLRFNRREKHEPASLLSFRFACADDKTTIPTRTTYMYTPKITATHNGEPINIFAPRFSRDDTQHAWLGSVDVMPETFAKLQFPNPEITITINGVAWVFVAEKTGGRLVFNEERYTLKLTSLSCLLDTPRFIPRSNEYVDKHARQIINKELYGTGFVIGDWDLPIMTSWVIPLLRYENQTPIQVIGDIVKQVGGRLECDRIERKLHVRRRWKVSAWEMRTENPDVELSTVIREIVDTPRVTQRCTRIQVMNQKEIGNFDRANVSDIIEHDLLERPLATDQASQTHVATQALSETGEHCEHKVVTELYPEENINLAKFSDIWKVHDPRGHWQGTIKAIEIDVSEMTDSEASVVTQTLTIDRYKGD